MAQIALSIQNRWDVPTFVKMHEIVVLEDEDYEGSSSRSVFQDFERGLRAIMEFLEMDGAFRLVREGETKYRLAQVKGAKLPSWISDLEKPAKAPDGIFECPHCGKWFNNDVEYSAHTKLHYII